MYKINVDAAKSSKDHRVGLGALVRNSVGKVVAASFYQSQFKGSVSFAKAEAVQWGIQVAREAGITSCIIESDCVEVVELVNNTLRVAE